MAGFFFDNATRRATDLMLRAASPQELIQGFKVLSARIHASETARVAELDRTADLRAQRDLIEAELLRRMGAGS